MKTLALLFFAFVAAPLAEIAAAEPLFETTGVFPFAPKNKPNYRIPAILQARNGDLLIFAEKRNDGIGDIGNHDIVLKRSRDKGKTWSAEQVLFDDDDRTSTDITVGLDRMTGKLWLFFLIDKKKFAYLWSEDNGLNWKGPVAIHDQVTRPEWDKLKSSKDDGGADPSSGGRGAAWAKGWHQRYGVGPGNAMVQLRSGPKAGRLIVPARHREDIGKGRLRSFTHCFFSDDHGASWKLGGTVGLHTSECQLVELATGDVMVVARNESADDAPDNLRHLVAVSRDGGETWGPVRRAEELITPRCHGCVERFTLTSVHDKNRLLFSSPASPFRQKEHPYGRYNLTIRLSYDEGVTWTAGKTIWPHPSSYSDIVVLDDMTLGYVYERGAKGTTHYWDEIQFARFNLEWLTDGRDSLRVRKDVPARKDVKLPALFSDHMVLQAGAQVPVWGWAAPGEKITVSLAGQSKTVVAGADGTWLVKLDKLEPTAKQQTLTVKGPNIVTVNDVLVGEAWLCSGQSNMAMQLKGLHGQVDRADEEIAAANYPQLRMFVYKESYDIYALPQPPQEALTDRPGEWLVCSPATAARFSALGYYFGRDLHKELGVPIGLINSSVGGTPIEAWTSLEAQHTEPALRAVLEDWQKKLVKYDPESALKDFGQAKERWLKQRAEARAKGQEPPKAPARFRNLRVMAPGGLFNGMIAPLAPFKVRGVLWYQGERNAQGPLSKMYGVQLKTLINDWRTRWGDELYFAWVQLPRFQKAQKAPSEPNGWGVAVREEMLKTLAIPRTGMAVTIDLGGVTDGHPTNKADFARRLSLLALHDVYGKPIRLWCGPLFRSARRDGQTMVLTFAHAAGLKAAGNELTGFALAGEDRKFVWAKARIVDDKVIVWSDKEHAPAAVRYAWAANPRANLVNGAGLPASPFRTDEWVEP